VAVGPLGSRATTPLYYEGKGPDGQRIALTTRHLCAAAGDDKMPFKSSRDSSIRTQGTLVFDIPPPPGPSEMRS